MSADTSRVYIPSGRVAHLTPQGTVTLCGLWYPEGFWGTGSQEEYERAESLTLCKHCLRKNGGQE
jgi:hypothetical protein